MSFALYAVIVDFTQKPTGDASKPADPTAGTAIGDPGDLIPCLMPPTTSSVNEVRWTTTWLIGALTVAAGVAALPVAPSGALPPAPSSGCGSSAPSLSPATPDEQTLVGYFEALDARNYGAAWGFFGDGIRSMYGSQRNYVAVMNEHVDCVRLLGVTPYGPHTYLVNLAAQYVTPFPAGSGALPDFWTVDDGVIVEVGTGPPR